MRMPCRYTCARAWAQVARRRNVLHLSAAPGMEPQIRRLSRPLPRVQEVEQEEELRLGRGIHRWRWAVWVEVPEANSSMVAPLTAHMRHQILPRERLRVKTRP